MRRLIRFCIVVSLVLIASPAIAGPVYFIDLGSGPPPGVTLAEWGPIQPTTSGGNWGGMGSMSAPGSFDQLCRTVWGHTIGGLNWAAVTFATPIDSIDIRHLDGIADDSFAVNALPSGTSWGTYTWSGNTAETWVTTTFSGAVPTNTIVITATGAAWASFGTYGQLGIDWINAVPEPSTICLLGLGGLALLRKRRA